MQVAINLEIPLGKNVEVFIVKNIYLTKSAESHVYTSAKIRIIYFFSKISWENVLLDSAEKTGELVECTCEPIRECAEYKTQKIIKYKYAPINPPRCARCAILSS